MTTDTANESEDDFTFNDVISMLFIDMLIFSFLAWYFGNVRPVTVTEAKLLSWIEHEASRNEFKAGDAASGQASCYKTG